MNEDKDTTTPKIPSPVVDVDDEEVIEDDEVFTKVPRSGKRRLMPIERLR